MDIKQVKKLMSKIKQQFSNSQYQLITGDMRFENVPKKIWCLWYSDESGSFAIRNMDFRYGEMLRGNISMDEFFKMLSDLYADFADEFALLKKID